MALKIKRNVENKSDWLLVDADFRSLQMCLAMADCGLNSEGIDQVCYDIYGPGGSNDAHSVTGFNTFIQPIHGKILELTCEKTGKKYVFGHEQKIKVKRKDLTDNSEEKEILGKDFDPSVDIYISDKDGEIAGDLVEKVVLSEREMTFEDFMKLKKIKPFKGVRSDAKGINFGALFGCSGPSLGVQLKGYGFDETKVTTAMNNFNLTQVVNSKILSETKKGKSPDPLAIKYSVVGTKIRELFFNIYPCLLERTIREQKFAKKHGYVRAWTGPVRHLPELRFMKKNAEGEVVGADAILYKSEFAHLNNDATNSPIQTAEVYQAMPDMTAIMNTFLILGLRSRLFNTVHDSGEFYIYKPERDLVYSIFTYVASVNRMPYFDIPMHIDVEESDLDDNEVFREGREINIENFDFKTELKNWCEKFHKDFKFEDVDPAQWIPIHGIVDNGRKIKKAFIPRKMSSSIKEDGFEIVN